MSSEQQQVRTITQEQYWQLVGLRAVWTDLSKQMDALERAAMAITGEQQRGGHTTDMLASYRDLDEGLAILGITVTPTEQPSPTPPLQQEEK